MKVMPVELLSAVRALVLYQSPDASDAETLAALRALLRMYPEQGTERASVDQYP